MGIRTLLLVAGLCLSALAHSQDPRPLLRVGVYDNPPKVFPTATGGGGIFPELLGEIAAGNGWRLQYVRCEWRQCLELLHAGQLDLMPDVALTDERERLFQFHRQPVLVAWTQGYRAPGVAVTSVLDLQGKRVAVVDGSVQQAMFGSLADSFGLSVRVLPVRSFQAALETVALGQADVALVNNFYGDAHAWQYGLRETPLLFQPARLFFAARPGLDPAVLAAIDRWLERAKADPDSVYTALVNRARRPATPAWVWPAVGVGAALLVLITLLAVLSSRILKRQVEHRTLQLRTSEQRLGTILDSADSLIYIKDRHYRYQYVNAAMAAFTGQPRAAIIGRTDAELAAAPQAEHFRMSDARVLEEGERTVTETVVRGPDGTLRTYVSRKIPLRDASGFVYALCGISTEITEQRKAEASHRIATRMFESMVPIAITDAAGLITEFNDAFRTLAGPAQAQAGLRVPALAAAPDGPDCWDEVLQRLRGELAVQQELWLRRPGGALVPVLLAASSVPGADGAISQVVLTMIDLSREKQAVDEANRLAYYDPLTSLPNRRLLLERLEVLDESAAGLGVALLHLDVDHFTALNAAHGQAAADEVLKELASRFLALLKGADLVARLTADRFAFVINTAAWDGADPRRGADRAACALRQAVGQPFHMPVLPHGLTASIGCALRTDGTPAGELLVAAEFATGQAKRAGGNQVCFHDTRLRASVAQQARLTRDLRHAALRGELALAYQVQADRLGRITGAEALLRWQHPELGAIGPDRFIPLAEESGQIDALGAFVLQSGCAELARWSRDPRRAHYRLSLNVSARQFAADGFVAQVTEALETSGCPPGQLCLELTESLFIANTAPIAAKMQSLRARGVRFSLDDFGTGYATLAYLKKLPFDELKIDRSFVRDLLHDANDAALVRGIVGVAASLQLDVIAEGVETEAQRRYLEQMGCARYQGYLFGRPAPPAEFDQPQGRADARPAAL